MPLQMTTPAGLGTSIALDLSSNGQPCRARSLHCWQQASEALREHLFPHLSLPTLMALSRASSDWHQLISTTPPTQLAGHQRRDLLPHGMISHQPLCEVLQERGSLVARLSHDTVPYQHSESHVQGTCFLSWSPQPDISRPSQHILISRPQAERGHQEYERDASVLDLLTGRLIEFQAARSCGTSAAHLHAGKDQHKIDESHQQALDRREHRPARCINIRRALFASWAADARHAIITLSNQPTSPHPADPSGRAGSHILVDTLLRTRAMMLTRACERFPRGAISPTGNMILSTMSPSLGSDICHNIYQLPTLQHRFPVAPPAFPDDSHQTRIKCEQFAWSPDGSKLAVWWMRISRAQLASTSSPSVSSLSNCINIYRADNGKCVSSTKIVPHNRARNSRSTRHADSTDSSDVNGTGDDDDDVFACIEWDPSSSYVLWRRKDRIACIHPAQGQVWQSSRQERDTLGRQSDSIYQDFTTTVRSAASGQYLSITDYLSSRLKLLTMLDALTGRVMSQWDISPRIRGMVWASQSDVCLLPSCSFVLIPAAGAAAAAAADVAVADAYQPGMNLEYFFWASSPTGSSTRQPACTPENFDITQHSWHKFALAAPALPGSEGTPSPANTPHNETYTMQISPCGTVEVGVKDDGSGANADHPSGGKVILQHWHLPHVRKCSRTLATGTATIHVRPQECIGLVMPSQRTLHLAWHPQPRACTYACYDYQVGLRLVNARSDCVVRSWTRAELLEYNCEESAKVSGTKTSERRQLRVEPGSALAWSHDGCRLAVLVGKHCAVLQF